MIFTKAYAQAQSADVLAAPIDGAAGPGSMGSMEGMIMNIAPIAILMVLFYVLLIMPQQRRAREHAQMLSDLGKGDKIVTGGGLVGTIDKVLDDDEVLLDLGGGVKVTALRSMIQAKADPSPANDDGGKAGGKKNKKKK